MGCERQTINLYNRPTHPTHKASSTCNLLISDPDTSQRWDKCVPVVVVRRLAVRLDAMTIDLQGPGTQQWAEPKDPQNPAESR